MLRDKMLAAVLPAKDIQRAKDFYENKLGLDVQSETDDGIIFGAGQGTGLLVYEKDDMVSASHTVAGFNVDDIEQEVEELRGRGVDFEDYDMPGLKTINGIAARDGKKSAWFRDTEGNILAISQM